MFKLPPRFLVCSLAAVLPLKIYAVPLAHTGITTSIPVGSNNGGLTGASAAQAYIDDVDLQSITYGGVTFSGSAGQIRRPSDVRVSSFDRSVINAEFGDQDTGSDGNPNPFVKSGAIAPGDVLTAAIREAATPGIQDAALTAAFDNLSLNEGTDGEGGDYLLDIIYEKGVVDNNIAADNIPEIIFFERGRNSDISVRVITGGTLASPTLSTNSVTINRGDFVSTGIFINTIEIDGGQELGAAGLDLTDFGLADGTVIYGVRIASINGTGADLYGQFITAENQSQLSDLPTGLIPEPATWISLAIGCGLLVGNRRFRLVRKYRSA